MLERFARGAIRGRRRSHADRLSLVVALSLSVAACALDAGGGAPFDVDTHDGGDGSDAGGEVEPQDGSEVADAGASDAPDDASEDPDDASDDPLEDAAEDAADAAGDAHDAGEDAEDAPSDAGGEEDAALDAGDAESDAADAAPDAPSDGGTACAPEERVRACGALAGGCTPGSQRCEGGRWTACTGGTTPAAEACDGIDNDCDGAVDEGCACTDGVSKSCGLALGQCTTGTQDCAGGALTACNGDVAPSPEECDGIDNDCNGAIDEGCACTLGAERACGTEEGACHPGVQRCPSGVWGPCEDQVEPTPERCDGLDNDCDGLVDDGSNACGGVCPLAAAPGEPCDGTDSDACLDDSAICDGMNATRCSAGDDDADVCNGEDDDCSAGPDTAFACVQGASGTSCTTTCGSIGTGTCSASCTLPSPADCAPPAEVCNGVDDDCVGGADDGFACVQHAPGLACTTTCGSIGTGACTASCALPGPAECTPPEEVCNGLDDDCVGGADDVFACVQGAKVTCTTACGSSGTGTCSATCTRPAAADCTPPAEVCNGLDDDCVGGADDGFACAQGAVGVACTTTCGSTGVGTCTATCTLPAGADCAPPAESCNGLDDDCDGEVDNGTNACGGVCELGGQPGAPCDSPDDLDDCADDVFACDGPNGVVCVNAGIDSDADGYSLSSDFCRSDCDDGRADVNPGGAEACNGVDDDCDGSIDAATGFEPLPAGLVLMFHGACPEGWGELLAARHRLLRGSDGDAELGEIGGSDAPHVHGLLPHTHFGGSTVIPSHTHTITLSTSSASIAGGWTAEGTVSRALPHSHNAPVSGPPDRATLHQHVTADDLLASAPSSALPAYMEVVLCENLAADVYATPPLALTIADGRCPSGWVEDAAFSGRMARGSDGDELYAEIGGDDWHAHDLSHDHGGMTADSGVSSFHYHTGTLTSSAPSSSIPFLSGTVSVAAGAHVHTISIAPSAAHAHGIAPAPLTSESELALPPYREVSFCRADAPVCPEDGTAALFAQTCPSGWTELTALRDRFLRGEDGDGTAGETGGADTHDHAHAEHDHGGLSAQAGHSHTVGTGAPSATGTVTPGTGWDFASGTHTHTGVTSTAGLHDHTLGSVPAGFVDPVANDPAWIEVVVCQRNAPGAG